MNNSWRATDNKDIPLMNGNNSINGESQMRNAAFPNLFPDFSEERSAESVPEPNFKLTLSQFNKLLSYIGCPVCSSRNVPKNVVTNRSILSMEVICRCGIFFWDSTLTADDNNRPISVNTKIEVNPNQEIATESILNQTREIKVELLDEPEHNFSEASCSIANQQQLNDNGKWKAEYLAAKSGKNGVFVYRLKDEPSRCYVFQLRKTDTRGNSSWSCIGCRKSQNAKDKDEEEDDEPILGFKSVIKIKDGYFLSDPTQMKHTCTPKIYLEEMCQRLRYMIYQGIETTGRQHKEQTALDIYREQVAEVLDGLDLGPGDYYELEQRLSYDSTVKRMINKKLCQAKGPDDGEDEPLPQKKRAFDLSYKLDVIEYAEKSKNLAAAAAHFNVHRKQISQWIEQKNQIIAQMQQNNPKPSKRLGGGGRPPKYAEIETKLIQWIDDQVSLNIKVSRSMVRTKAIQLADDFPDFKASNGWLEKFMKRLKGHQFVTSQADLNQTELDQTSIDLYSFLVDSPVNQSIVTHS